MHKDSIYSKPQSNISQFTFDEHVVDVFEDMIHRSVPGYGAIVSMIGMLAAQYVKPKTRCYDLGCSLGASTLAMRHNIDVDEVKIIAVDNAEAMITQCRNNMAKVDGAAVEIVCDDIANVTVDRASMVVLNFTLQFVDVAARLDVMKTIYDGMVDGGILVLSEKIHFEDDQENAFQTEMHHTFKRLQGYSDLEISQKRTALEKVLMPDTLEDHLNRLQCVGFKKTHVWFQCFNFVSVVAIK